MVDYSKWNNLDDYDSDYGEGELFCSHHSHNKENIKRGMNIEPAWIEKISIKKPVLPSYYVGSPLQKSQYQEARKIHRKYFEHTTLKFDPRIHIHTSDSISEIHPIFFTDPMKFVPAKDNDSGQHILWGLQEVYQDYFSLHMRRMTTPFLYNDGGGKLVVEHEPAVQFIQALAFRKEMDILKYRAANPSELVPRDYILDIVVSDISPRIWRRVNVSSAMPLSVFQDKVICPALGWLRNYHGYIFTDSRDGAQFGPIDTTAADFVHLPLNGYVVVDDSKYTIGDILRKKNDIMYYSYDLGDHFEHIIRLTAIRPHKDSSGKCIVLAGEMSGLPEDSHGLPEQKGNSGYQALLNLWKTCSVKRKQQLQNDISQALNFLQRNERFDPFEFDVNQCQAQVLKALASHTSLRFGTKHIAFPTPTSEELVKTVFVNRTGRTKDVIQPIKNNKQFIKETVLAVRDPKSNTACICGNPYKLKTCGSCRMVWYCGEECQVKHWKDHRFACKQLTVRRKALSEKKTENKEK